MSGQSESKNLTHVKQLDMHKNRYDSNYYSYYWYCFLSLSSFQIAQNPGKKAVFPRSYATDLQNAVGKPRGSHGDPRDARGCHGSMFRPRIFDKLCAMKHVYVIIYIYIFIYIYIYIYNHVIFPNYVINYVLMCIGIHSNQPKEGLAGVSVAAISG